MEEAFFLEDTLFLDQREGVSQEKVWLKEVCTSAGVLGWMVKTVTFSHEDTFIACLREVDKDFPGGPVAKTPCSQCRGLGSIPGQRDRSHVLHCTTKKEKKKKNKRSRCKISAWTLAPPKSALKTNPRFKRTQGKSVAPARLPLPLNGADNFKRHSSQVLT